MITWENYEEYMVMHADGELTTEQEQALMSFLYEHPDLQGELTAFTMTKMTPDAAGTYAHKDSLMRPETTAKPIVVAFPHWRRYAVAAAIAALLAVPGYRFIMQPAENGLEGSAQVAAVTPATALPTNNNHNQPATTETAINTPNSAKEAQHPIAAVATVPATVARPVPGHRALKATRNSTAAGTRAAATANVNDAHALAMAEISPLAIATAKMIETSEKKFVPVVTNAPTVAIEYTESDNESVAAGSLIDKVPMSETRRSGMKSFAADVATGYSRVSNVTQEIAEASVSFKIGKRQLKVSF